MKSWKEQLKNCLAQSSGKNPSSYRMVACPIPKEISKEEFELFLREIKEVNKQIQAGQALRN